MQAFIKMTELSEINFADFTRHDDRDRLQQRRSSFTRRVEERWINHNSFASSFRTRFQCQRRWQAFMEIEAFQPASLLQLVFEYVGRIGQERPMLYM